MSRKIGTMCILIGVAMLLGAGALFCFNERENTKADNAAGRAVALVRQEILRRVEVPDKPTEEAPDAMPAAEINGWGYIGYLRIPALKLELPVMDQWDYERLKRSPCRYSGTTMGGDLVLMAHNYRTHFGPIRRLKPGDEVVFVDMDGITLHYLVTAATVVEPDAPEAVTQSGHDLTLMTCTYGGRTRTIVYCDMADDRRQ